ncbi:hypothetical protein [Streptosporangium longisporum]|uniref:Uncharacterized protein n=1 Tax=Streptosporangium longisporum TaxID=46187 RepID=A0ABN3Y6J9_9ACTN
MIERTDQLVLDYVAKVADAAHGVLPPRQRIDFVTGLRRRIDAERTGTDDPAAVARMLAGFGDPVELVGQELRRLGRQEASRLPGVPAHASPAHASPALASPSSASPASAVASAASAYASSDVVPAPASPLAAPTSRDPGDPDGPDNDGDDAGVPAPRRPVRGHPYASSSPSDPSVSPDRASVPGRRSEDEWDDAVEGDPPTEEIPPVPPAPLTPPAPDPSAPPVPDPLAPPVPNPVAPPAPDPLAPSVPDPLAPSVPDPLAPSVPDPLAPPVPGPVPQTEPGEEGEPRGKGPGNGDAPGKGSVRPGMPPGVARGVREAEERLAKKQARARPGLLRRNRPPRSREDIVPGTQDARTILLGHRLETVGMALLTLAGLLIPFPFATIAIFTVPVLVWAVGAVVVVACQAWLPADKVIGIVSPMLSYTLGGGLVALVRARGDIGRVVEEFFTISGLMFLLGTAWGVFWLTYRLLNPVIQPGRGRR